MKTQKKKQDEECPKVFRPEHEDGTIFHIFGECIGACLEISAILLCQLFEDYLSRSDTSRISPWE